MCKYIGSRKGVDQKFENILCRAMIHFDFLSARVPDCPTQSQLRTALDAHKTDEQYVISRKCSSTMPCAEPSASSAKPNAEILIQQRPHTHAAASVVPLQPEAENSILNKEPCTGLSSSTSASLTFLKHRQLMRTLSGSRCSSFDLGLADDTYVSPTLDSTQPQIQNYSTVRISRADEMISTYPQYLTVQRNCESTKITDKKPSAVAHQHQHNTRGSLFLEHRVALGIVERPQASAPLCETSKCAPRGALAASTHLLPHPSHSSGEEYPGSNFESESETCLKFAIDTLITMPPPRLTRPSRYSSVELPSSDDGEEQESPIGVSGSHTASVNTESSKSQVSSGRHSFLPTSSSNASSVCDCSQPESPQSVLQSAVGLRSLPVIGSLFSARHSKPVSCRQGAPAGIQNLGNTCFASSVLQCLRAAPGLKAAICAAVSAGRGPAGAPITSELAQLLEAMEKAPPRVVLSPARLLDALAERDERWWGGEQQDAQEFLQALLEALQDEAGPPTGAALYRQLSGQGTEAHQAASAWSATAEGWLSSPLGALLGGQLQSTVTCTVCGGASHCFDRFTDLSLPIPQSRTGVTLQGCLSAFTAAEAMPAAGGFRCAACRCQQSAIKRLALRRCPAVLVLSLKRFASTSMTGGFASCVKNTTAVRLPPDTLSLAEFCSGNLSVAEHAPDEPVYDLMGLVSHVGSIDTGHYTATVRGGASPAEQSKGHLGGLWYHCSDEHVGPTERPSSQASSQAYLLLYVRRHSS